ncbi:MAG TPA: hypothetical protein VF796_11710, partial [Humisphaera sp.]
MLYHLTCPGCGLPVPYHRAQAGRTVACRACRRTVLTPPVPEPRGADDGEVRAPTAGDPSTAAGPAPRARP